MDFSVGRGELTEAFRALDEFFVFVDEEVVIEVVFGVGLDLNVPFNTDDAVEL